VPITVTAVAARRRINISKELAKLLASGTWTHDYPITYERMANRRVTLSSRHENGSFTTTETMFCRYSIKLPLDIVLDELERTLNR
jgi:hypothetical protein